MSDLYIESRLQAIKEIASARCSDIKDVDNISSLCDEIYSAIPNTDNIVAELKNKSFKAMNYPDRVVDLNEAIKMVKRGGVDDIQKCDSVDCSCMYIDRSRV